MEILEDGVGGEVVKGPNAGIGKAGRPQGVIGSSKEQFTSPTPTINDTPRLHSQCLITFHGMWPVLLE
jgi:hypothetical protein